MIKIYNLRAMYTYENKGFRFLPKKLIILTLDVFDRLSLVLVRARIHPNLLSLLGLVAGFLVGLFFALRKPGLALIFLIICGMMDILDGKVAVNGNKKSAFGAVFDSSLDRYSEFAIYLGLGFYYGYHWMLLVLAIAFFGSSMVSYTKARAESLGIKCQLGIMQRAERMVLLMLGTLAGIIFNRFDQIIAAVIILIAVASHLTTWQRIIYVHQEEKKKAPN